MILRPVIRLGVQVDCGLFVGYALLIDWSTYLLTNHNCVSLLQVGSIGRPQLTFQAPPPRPAGQRQRKKMVSFSFIKTQLHYYIICIYASTVVYALCYWSQLGEKRVLTHGDERQASHRKEKRMA
jgi:hypothetical protein